jgi:regulator of protease activity HflC (stomatin/prohibitin superfamily)/membrane protein implicated in regulation of membrane protease activity
VGLLGLAGIQLPEWVQWLVFSGLAIVAMLGFRRRLYEMIRGRGGKVDERLTVGDRVVIPARLEPGQSGRVDYRGSSWSARNTGSQAIEAGREAVIAAVDGLTLHVKAEQQAMETMYVVGFIALLAIIIIAKTAVVVPQQSAFVVENLGRYSRTIHAGFHILVPFIERIAYKHNLKEEAMDIPEQICITRDNVQVGVDGVLYLQVLEASKASYGITNYRFAIIQLAQTTLRSEIGKIELDRTFEERQTINQNVVAELDKASAPWGVKVLRYEIKNINPPKDVLQAMEKQMRAEREKRAVVLTSEGERDAKINQAEGEKQRVIKESEANKQQQINEAQGEAAAILAVATATAEGLRQVGDAIAGRGGVEAMQLRVAEEYVKQFGTLASEAASTLVVPANLTDIASMIALATSVVKSQSKASP